MSDSTTTTTWRSASRFPATPWLNRLGTELWRHRYLYLMLVIPFAYFAVYRFYPIVGSVIAFKDYQLAAGIWGSPWVGFDHFRTLFNDEMFLRALRNTISIATLKLIFVFPAPIILALFLNEVRIMFFKRFLQTVVYVPHFMSWVIYAAILYVVLSVDTGMVNNIMATVGLDRIRFFQEPMLFQPIIVISSVLKETGFAAVIYLASMSTIDTHLYEAAHLDGANRWQLMRHVTLPGLAPTIMVLLLIQLGWFLVVGFDQVFIMVNNVVLPTGDIIETFVYRIGLQQGRFDYAAAAALFNSAVGLVLVVLADRVAKRFGSAGIL
jgi:putative aldouronate transport system permease protein